MLQKAEYSDKAEIAALYQAVKDAARERGNSTWTAQYPNEEILEADLAAGQLYILRREGRIAAAATLHPRDPEMEALTIPWRGCKPCYLSRLCVHPDLQNQHLGEAVMALVCQKAASLGYDSLRLCCNYGNPAAHRLYTRMGYVSLGSGMVDGAMHYLFENLLEALS